MTSFSRTRITAAAVAAACMAIPAPAQADYTPPTFRSDAAQVATVEEPAFRTDAAQAQQPPLAAASSTFPPAGFRGGDVPVDHPGASRTQPAPSVVEVVQPERTIIRDVDATLPLVLSIAAMLFVLAAFAVRVMPRSPRTH